jgi:type IV pilus assembly protein PilV
MQLRGSIKKQHGLGLIESLIALVIISIGLLGIAALQITSMQSSASAQWHTQAVWYSYEMTDRISANSNSFALYDQIDTDTGYSMDCQSAACTPGEMVTADAADWSNMVQTLPNGRGIISLDANNNLQVSVIWDDNSAENNCPDGVPASSDQSCFTVTITATP